MASSLYPVPCPFEDCLYHVRLAIHADQIYCSHPRKSMFHGSHACPLYQCNWAKNLETLRK